MKVTFTGIIRGSFSECQAAAVEAPVVIKFEGESIMETLEGLILNEFIYTLRINGKSIKNPRKYLEGKGYPVLFERVEQHEECVA